MNKPILWINLLRPHKTNPIEPTKTSQSQSPADPVIQKSNSYASFGRILKNVFTINSKRCYIVTILFLNLKIPDICSVPIPIWYQYCHPLVDNIYKFSIFKRLHLLAALFLAVAQVFNLSKGLLNQLSLGCQTSS